MRSTVAEVLTINNTKGKGKGKGKRKIVDRGKCLDSFIQRCTEETEASRRGQTSTNTDALLPIPSSIPLYWFQLT
jgi:hypothetical protein